MEKPDAPAAQQKLVLFWERAKLLEPLFAKLLPVVYIGAEKLPAHAIIPVAAQNKVAVGKGPVEGEIAAGAFAYDIAKAENAVGLLYGRCV